MADVLAPARHRVTTCCSDVEDIKKSLTKKQQTIKRFDEQNLNLQVLSVFDSASELLKKAAVNVTVIPKQIDVPYPQIALFRSQIENLNAELDRRTRTFDTTIEIARSAFSERLDKIQQEYRSRLNSLKNDNSSQENVLEKKLKEIQKSFESRLQKEIAIHIKERNEIQAKLVKLQSEYDLLYSTLSSSLTASQMRADLLEKQRSMLIETNENVTSTIEDKFKQQLEAMKSQCSVRLNSLEAENVNLKEEIKNSTEMYNIEMQRLSSQLQSIETTMEKKLQGILAQQLLIFEKKKRKMESKHQRTVSSVRHQIETEEMSSSNEAQLYRSQIEQKKKILAEADRRFEEGVATIEKRTEALIAEKKAEMDMTTKIHRKTLKQIQQKHSLKLEQETHDAAKQKRVLELKLQQTQREGEVTEKRLQREVGALTRAKNRFWEEIKQREENDKRPKEEKEKIENENKSKKMQKMRSTIRKCAVMNSTVADVRPRGIASQPEVEAEIHERISKFQESGKMELLAISREMNAVEAQFNSEQYRWKLKVDEAKRKHVFLENEKKILIDRIKEAQDVLDKLNERKKFITPEEEAALHQRIADQHNLIAQMKQDIQKVKDEGTKKVPIDEIKSEQEQEIKMYQMKLAMLKAEKDIKEQEIRSRFEKVIKEETTQANDTIEILEKKYAETMAEIEVTKGEYKEEAMEEHQKWMTTRKEMADSNNRLLGAIQVLDKQRLESPNRIRNVANRAAPLPILRR